MIISIEIPDYTPQSGVRYDWQGNYMISVQLNPGAVVIRANEDGLRSLANHLLNLAQPGMPVHNHMHFDSYNSLEEGSIELIIEKIA